ncbi:retrovirus-related pol polyprotein from transposon TNT 1-94 [Tanacetum coccineum]
MRKVWKSTGKVFNKIGYSWKPIGRTVIIVGNRFPLTRITSTKVMPTKETSTKSVATVTHGILVYSRRPNVTRYGYSSVEGDLRKFSDIGAWDDMVRVQAPRCMAWLDYVEHKDCLSMIDNDVGITSPKSTTQTLPLFEEYTLPVTYPGEVENTLGTLIEEMFGDDWGLESKEFSSLGEELSLFDKLNEANRGRILEAHRLESILQQQISQHMASSHNNGKKAHLLEDKQIPSVRVFDEVVQIDLWYLDSDCSKHMTGNRSQLINFVSNFLGTVRFGNDHIVKIIGYGNYQMGDVTISLVYYVEGLGQNLFFVGQFFDSDLEVAFCKHTCFIRDLDGVDLLKGSRGLNLYTLSMDNLLLSYPICLLSKASKTKSWLWHRRLSHLNFDYITSLTKQGLVRGLPKLKYQKDHFSPCDLVPNPPSCVDPQVPTIIESEPVVSTGTPSSTTIDQDAPSSSTSQTTQETPPLFIPLSVEEADHDINVAYMDNNPNVDFLIPEPSSKESSTQAIRIFIAFAAHMKMVVYQIDVKTAFLNGILHDEKLTKGTVNPTLFVRREDKDILLMSVMGKLSFFLGLQISQSPRGIFLNQSKYDLESLKKFSMETCEPADTPMVEKSKLDEDPQRKPVDPTRYRGMIGTLMYITSIRPDLVFDVCMCARVKISSTNLKLETIVPQKEEKFQVMIDVIKNSTCFKALTISADILDICPRVEGEEYTELQNDDDTLTFLLVLGYKGPLHKYTNMYVDHMSQPWRTLAAIINKSLSGKIASNDRLRKSRIDIMWAMFHKDNDDYPALIWEDSAYQIDHRKERRSRRENMPYPRFTKIIINHFLKQHKYLSNLKYQHYHTIKDDGIVSRLKFVRIGEDYQEYGLEILDIFPKKSIGKGSQGKKTVDESQETVDVSEESEPEPVKKKTTSKSISLTKAKEAEETRKVHATHARIMNKSVPESAKKKSGGRSSRGVAIQDTSSAPKPKPATSKPKLKGAQSLTPAKQETADIMQALKERKTSKRHPGTGGSSEEIGTIPGVPDESIFVLATSSERTGTKPWVPDEENDITKEKVILEWGLEQESEYSEEDQLDDEEKEDKEGDADDEGDDHINEDEEMLNDEAEDSGKGDAEVSDAAKDTTYAKISSLLNIKIQSEVLHIQYPSVLRVLVSVISEPTVLTPAQETSSGAPVTTLPLPSVSTTPPAPQQTTTPIPTPLITADAPTITTAILESDALSVVQLRVVKLEKDVFELKNVDHSTATIATLKSQGVADTVKDHKRKHDNDEDDDYEDPPAGPNQGKKTKRRRIKESESSKKPSTTKETLKGKDPFKGSKTGKSASAKESAEEPTSEVVMDDAGKDVVHDNYQPQDTSEPKTTKTSNPEWFTQPPRPPTPDPEWNKCQVVLGQPKQPWFNQMVSATKDPLTFNNLIATPIDFSKYVLNRLKIDNLTQDILLGPAYNLFKGTCHPDHLTVAADYFFNNDLEYLKSSDPERTYTTSITKTKVARYEIEGIEEMLFHLTNSDIVDFIMALRMFTRSLIIKKWVEDLQLGVESYQKKLNITPPQQTFPEIELKELYTLPHKLPGVIYEDLVK